MNKQELHNKIINKANGRHFGFYRICELWLAQTPEHDERHIDWINRLLDEGFEETDFFYCLTDWLLLGSYNDVLHTIGRLSKPTRIWLTHFIKIVDGPALDAPTYHTSLNMAWLKALEDEEDEAIRKEAADLFFICGYLPFLFIARIEKGIIRYNELHSLREEAVATIWPKK